MANTYINQKFLFFLITFILLPKIRSMNDNNAPITHFNLQVDESTTNKYNLQNQYVENSYFTSIKNFNSHPVKKSVMTLENEPISIEKILESLTLPSKQTLFDFFITQSVKDLFSFYRYYRYLSINDFLKECIFCHVLLKMFLDHSDTFFLKEYILANIQDSTTSKEKIDNGIFLSNISKNITTISRDCDFMDILEVILEKTPTLSIFYLMDGVNEDLMHDVNEELSVRTKYSFQNNLKLSLEKLFIFNKDDYQYLIVKYLFFPQPDTLDFSYCPIDYLFSPDDDISFIFLEHLDPSYFAIDYLFRTFDSEPAQIKTIKIQNTFENPYKGHLDVYEKDNPMIKYEPLREKFSSLEYLHLKNGTVSDFSIDALHYFLYTIFYVTDNKKPVFKPVVVLIHEALSQNLKHTLLNYKSILKNDKDNENVNLKIITTVLKSIHAATLITVLYHLILSKKDYSFYLYTILFTGHIYMEYTEKYLSSVSLISFGLLLLCYAKKIMNTTFLVRFALLMPVFFNMKDSEACLGNHFSVASYGRLSSKAISDILDYQTNILVIE